MSHFQVTHKLEHLLVIYFLQMNSSPVRGGTCLAAELVKQASAI